jgi:hypothetical protein
MTKKIKGSFTIEAAVIVPLLLLVCAVLMQLLFYYHDRTVLTSVSHETLAYACGRGGMDEGELEEHFKARVKGKLMMFSNVKQEVILDGEKVTVTCQAGKQPLGIKIQCVTRKTAPEMYIRNVRKLEELD